jgi:hypothetical protein
VLSVYQATIRTIPGHVAAIAVPQMIGTDSAFRGQVNSKLASLSQSGAVDGHAAPCSLTNSHTNAGPMPRPDLLC